MKKIIVFGIVLVLLLATVSSTGWDGGSYSTLDLPSCRDFILGEQYSDNMLFNCKNGVCCSTLDPYIPNDNCCLTKLPDGFYYLEEILQREDNLAYAANEQSVVADSSAISSVDTSSTSSVTNSYQSRGIDEVWATVIGKYVKDSLNNQVWQNGAWQGFEVVYPVSGSSIQQQSTPFNLGNAVNVYNQYKNIIDEAANKYNVPKYLIAAVIYKESGGNEKAVSECAAAGLMQFVPATAREQGLTVPEYGTVEITQTNCNGGNVLVLNGRTISKITNCYRKGTQVYSCDFNNDQRFNLTLSINAGAKYLQTLYNKQENNRDWNLVLQEYNGGTNKVQYAANVLNTKASLESAEIV